MKPMFFRVQSLVMVMLLSGCVHNPVAQSPKMMMPATWSAPLPHDGSTHQLVDWWAQFHDPQLSALLQQAEADNPSLAEAWANIAAARANLSTNAANLQPQVSASAGLTRAKSSSTTRSGLVDAAWEMDVFGKLKQRQQAATATLESRQDDWHQARVSLAAEVADTYVQYRACQQFTQIYQAANDSQQQTAELTRLSAEAGFTAPTDSALMTASAASSHAQWLSQKAECEVLVKSLLALVGGDEASLRTTLNAGAQQIPTSAGLTVSTVPADLLRQRPDLAAREREVVAAMASVNAANANRYPSFSLSGSISRSQSNSGITLSSWSFGPSVSLPIFDGGQRQAAVKSAEASRDAAVAVYQQTVRSAVKEVEQALVRVESARQRYQDAQTAAAGYQHYFAAAEQNWQAGNISVLAREEARRSALNAQSNLVGLQLEQIQQWIALYKAFGGGWQAEAGSTVAVSHPQGESL